MEFNRKTTEVADELELSGLIQRELEQMEPILNFQVPAEGLELVILLHTQY